MFDAYRRKGPGTPRGMPEDRLDDLHPEEEHEATTPAAELATEDQVEDLMSETPDDATEVDASEVRPEGSRDLGAGAGATTSDPGRVNPIIPGEGKIEEPT
jgi:hypothetical protein